MAHAKLVPAQPITLYRKDGSAITVRRVEPWPHEFVRALDLDGRSWYFHVHEIRSIEDAENFDWTHEVLDRGKGIGTLPLAPSGIKHPSGKLPDFRGMPGKLGGVPALVTSLAAILTTMTLESGRATYPPAAAGSSR
jgi:hypothetical protein